MWEASCKSSKIHFGPVYKTIFKKKTALQAASMWRTRPRKSNLSHSELVSIIKDYILRILKKAALKLYIYKYIFLWLNKFLSYFWSIMVVLIPQVESKLSLRLSKSYNKKRGPVSLVRSRPKLKSILLNCPIYRII